MSSFHTHKIALLLDGLEATTAGGTERQALVLARWLQEAGYHVSVYVFRGQQLSPDSQITNLRVRALWQPASLWRLLRFTFQLKRQRVCALQSFFVEANLLGPVLAWLAGVPVVLGSRRNVNHWMSPVFARLQQGSNHLCTAIIANSEAVKSATAKIERTVPEKIIVQYNGVDVAAIATAASRRGGIRHDWSLREDAVVIGVIATLRPVKGIEVFIDAAAAVFAREGRAHFVVIGDGPYRAELEQRARALGLGDRIRFVGESNDVPSLLTALDIAVLPSRSEGFSNALLEYMAAGLAIVATSVGGNAEALHGTGCLLVPAADAASLAKAILQLLESPTERKHIGGLAYQRARDHFDVSIAKGRTLEFYASLLRDHCSRSQEADLIA